MNLSRAIHFGQDLAEALGFHSTVPLLFAGDSRAGAWQKKADSENSLLKFRSSFDE